ncbi:hypothetical protein [Amycolatopsis antarctica]|uniref:hypothetical protein n=1 Tax=Amycolatopsis antarctica TaxID=1854586 RepID=UPI003B82FFFB
MRAGLVESVHYGSMAMLDPAGAVLFAAGEPDAVHDSWLAGAGCPGRRRTRADAPQRGRRSGMNASVQRATPLGYRLAEVRGVVLDIDGCLILATHPAGGDAKVLPGAVDAMCALRDMGLRTLVFANRQAVYPRTSPRHWPSWVSQSAPTT